MAMAGLRRTKIVATIGPACDEPGVLEHVLAAGVDVARLNASHGEVAELARRLAAIRTWAEDSGRVVGVLLDLPGPKLRVGDMAEGTVLTEGSEFVLSAGSGSGDASHACVSWGGLAADVSAGDRILLADGSLELRVISVGDGDVVTRVVHGGALGSHKGVNVPGVSLRIDGVTDRDLELLAWGLDAGVDLVAQSFVRSAGDVERLRAAMGDRRVPIVAKVEKHEALGNLDAIVAAADAVMVARGDLAVETSAESVPPAQRRIVETCRAAGRPVIVATQMLESMTHAPSPTRAEASDVATAVFEGADAVMLSEETAIGEFPAEAVATMDRVCRAAEESGPSVPIPAGGAVAGSPVAAAAFALARDTGARVIVTATQSGATARAVASLRPLQPVLAVTPFASVAGALAIVWGVACAVGPATHTIEETTGSAVDAVRRLGFAGPGERVVLTAGTTPGVTGSTDLVRVITL
jgi:pyruvate kinase